MEHETTGKTDDIPELRIIAEDDVHAVVAVRIKKAWLASNLHFLAALADVAVAPHILPIT
ncbi:hypothetical protein JQ633_12690 [Bradyrhizobium tropiciagri]|uniref:hypothetical protein n=1 Tax=Bradyrhizobium tropiciagri TaxID=312253 RepID=UPI001BA59AF0|nr:hypothetical protein [Bradyrhizobium tropiciagri]MBR0871221.1 hypothetical protein [Bradyrhizobium tropiciagri]